MKIDPATEAAIRHILKGQGPSRSARYIVEVNGGRIVSVAQIERPVQSVQLPERRTAVNIRAPQTTYSEDGT